jgi:hypothetical protein
MRLVEIFNTSTHASGAVAELSRSVVIVDEQSNLPNRCMKGNTKERKKATKNRQAEKRGPKN